MAEIDLNAFFEAEFAEHRSVAAASAAASNAPAAASLGHPSIWESEYRAGV